MIAKFVDIYRAADFLGPGAIEVPLYQQEIKDLVARRSLFGRRIKQVPVTGHPSRFLEGGGERSVPLKALVAQINYDLFDMELSQQQQQQFAYLQAKDLADTIDGVLRMHDIALWNGTDTSLRAPTTEQYFGAAAQIAAGGSCRRVVVGDGIIWSLKDQVVSMVALGARPTAIYANPLLLDLIYREAKVKFRAILPKREIENGVVLNVLHTAAGELPLIPEWTLPYSGDPGSGSSVLPAYIVTEDMIEYHWLSDTSPRVFQIGVPGSLASQYVVVKFGGLVVKNASVTSSVPAAHSQVLVLGM